MLLKLLVDAGTDRTLDDIYAMFEGVLYEGCVLAMEINPLNML